MSAPENTADLFQKTLDALSRNIAILDEQGTILHVNEAWRSFMRANGGTEERCGTGASYLDVCKSAPGLPEARAAGQAIEEILRGRRSEAQIDYDCHSSTEKRWFSLRLAAFSHGGRIRIVAAHSNITARRLAEQEAEATLRLVAQGKLEWESTIDSLPEAVFLMNREGIVVRANRTVERWNLSPVLSVHGKDFHQLLDLLAPGQGLIRKLVDTWELIYSGQSDSFRIENSGSSRGFRVDVHPIDRGKNPAGTADLRAPFAVIVVSDITAQISAERQQKLLEEKLLQAQKMTAIGTLAGGIAHDFNNLLVVINGYAQVLLKQLDPSSPMHEDVRNIFEAGERAAGLTRQLLAFSRQKPSEMQLVSLNAVIGGMEKLFRRLIREDIRLKFRFSESDGRVMGDIRSLEQVILNLILNAQDAMPNGGELTVHTRLVSVSAPSAQQPVDILPGQYVMITVEDNGSGMTPEVRNRVIEPFFTTKDVGSGTGLGLSVVYGVVQSMKGYLRIDSAPGAGTRVEIYLPAAAGDEKHAGETVLPATRGTNTILLVEDEPAVRALACRALREAGYHILEAPDGESALKLSDGFAGDIHLLLTDVVMPGMDGIQLSREVTARRPGIEALFLSGYPDRNLSGTDAIPEDRLVMKPYNIERLIQRIQKLLAARTRH